MASAKVLSEVVFWPQTLYKGMRFSEWLLSERIGERFSDFEKNGKVTLYHYLAYSVPEPAKTVTLDPKRFGANSFTLNDTKASGIPRVFFYLDANQKERWFRGSPCYKVSVPASSIYDVLEDPDGIKERLRASNQGVLQMGALLSEIKRAGYMGVYYNPGMHLVNYFYPIKATLTEEPAKRKGKNVPVDIRSGFKRAS